MKPLHVPHLDTTLRTHQNRLMLVNPGRKRKGEKGGGGGGGKKNTFPNASIANSSPILSTIRLSVCLWEKEEEKKGKKKKKQH